MKKKLMSLMLTVVLLCSMLVGTAGAVDIESFSDVQSSDWFYQYVDFVTSNEYFVEMCIRDRSYRGCPFLFYRFVREN